MIWLLPQPSPPSRVIKLSLFLSLPVCSWSSLLTGEGGGAENLKLYVGKKAWSSTNHSILHGQLFQGFSLLFLLDDRRIRILFRIHNFDLRIRIRIQEAKNIWIWRIRIQEATNIWIRRIQIRIRNTYFMYIHLKSTKCCSDKRDIACEQSNTFAVFLTEISAISAQRKS
jgi:hypothetical protein